MTILRIIFAAAAVAGAAYLVWWETTHREITFMMAFLAAQVPYALTLLFIAIRCRFLSGNLVPLAVAIRGNGLAIAGTLIFPARLSELLKPFYFNALSPLPVAKGMALVIEERIWDIVALALLAALTLVLSGDAAGNSTLERASIVLAGIGFFGVAGLILIPKLAKRIPILAGIEARYGIFSKRSRWQSAGAFLNSVVIWALSVSFMVTAYSMSGLPQLDLAKLLFLFIASTLGLVISVTPGSLGTFEGVIVAVLAGYGIGWDAALAFAVGYRFCMMAMPVVIAAIALAVDGEAIAKVRSRVHGQT